MKFSTVIFSLPLIQERQLSASGEKNVHWLTELAQEKVWPGKLASST